MAVTSTGNTNFDPTIANTGFGGTTQGGYQLRLTFTPDVDLGHHATPTGTLLDGDGDGTPGGVNNFWFRVADAAHTIFVDKAATGGTGPLGSITNPYTTIADALGRGHARQRRAHRRQRRRRQEPGHRRRQPLVQHRLRQPGQSPLSDGSKFEIPQGVTVMVDAGAIIKLRGANIDVGSSAQGIDRSGGALQVLGTTGQECPTAPTSARSTSRRTTTPDRHRPGHGQGHARVRATGAGWCSATISDLRGSEPASS